MKITLKVVSEIEIPLHLHKEIDELILNRLKAHCAEQQQKDGNFPMSSRSQPERKNKKHRSESHLMFDVKSFRPVDRSYRSAGNDQISH